LNGITLQFKEKAMLCRRSLLRSAATFVTMVGASPAVRAQVTAQVTAQEAKLPVVASFSILGDITRAIGGDRIVLTILVQPGSDAHVYAPTPADAKAVAEARLVVTNGLKFESWMKRLMQASASKAVLVESARGVKGRVEKDAHGHGAKDKHGHDHGGLDPHAWQSVANVKLYVANIRDALVDADLAGKATYEANASRYLAELDALEGEIRATVAKIPVDRRKVITSHDAFGYFQQAYGIQFISPRGVSTEAEASAKDVARIIQQIKREKITAVFLENVSDQRLIQQIAKESGASIGGTLFSDALSKADGPAPTYIRMMRHNISMISEALLPRS
jgi:zinc/manganese transport system substrate-binding protein